MSKLQYFIKNRIWICTQEGTFLGEGRIKLLKEIDTCGSISMAAKKMNMSYKKAWSLINSINAQSKSPLVERTTGGKGGGGTIVTNAGKKAIKIFEQINLNSKKELDKELDNISF
ncbi:MAG: winged helix-turn-helix domain-containing protein [Bacteroidia bacterium]